MSPVLLFFALACQPTLAEPDVNTQPPAAAPTPAERADAALAALSGRYRLGTPVQHGSLKVWPVVDGSPKSSSDAVTLADALAAGSASVSEVSE